MTAMNDTGSAQPVPVKMYRSEDRLTVAAPMPGMEPEDILVEVTADDERCAPCRRGTPRTIPVREHLNGSNQHYE